VRSIPGERVVREEAELYPDRKRGIQREKREQKKRCEKREAVQQVKREIKRERE